MQIKSLVFGAMLTLGTAMSGQAQDLVDGANVDEILNISRGYGSATLGKQDNGDPKITGKIDGLNYQVYFMNCENNLNCEDLWFYRGFLDVKPPMETINAWNRDKLFGRAYLDSDLDAVIEYGVHLHNGVSRDNLNSSFFIWSSILDRFATYIDAK